MIMNTHDQVLVDITLNRLRAGTIEESDTQDLFTVLRICDDLYHNDAESPFTDSEYDALSRYARLLDPVDVYFTGVGSNVRGGKVKLPHQMGSLNQVQIGEIQYWIQQHKLSSSSLVKTDKLDGASALLVYDEDGMFQIAFSRGNGFEGADISRHVRLIPSVPKQIPATGSKVVVRAENIISKASFKAANAYQASVAGRIYKNARNMVSGMMNASENAAELYVFVDTVAYELVGCSESKQTQLSLLEQYGFKVVYSSTSLGSECTDDYLTKYLNQRKQLSAYELDGLVIDVDDRTVRADMHTGELNPAYAVKYKVAGDDNIARSEVVAVHWNVSKDGYFKPRIEIKPVELVGVTVTYATGFNAKFILSNNIGPGAVVEITRSGDVIPFITKVIHSSPYGASMPMLVSANDALWTESGVDLVLTNPESNPDVALQRLVDFFSTIDSPYLGEGTLRTLLSLGLNTPLSIIELTAEDMSNALESKSIGKKVFDGLRNKLTNIPRYVLMGAHHALGRGVGVRKMKKLYEAFAGDMSKCSSLDAIQAVDGFEVKTASKIVSGYSEYVAFEKQISPYVTIAEYEVKSGKLSGKSVVITGFRSADLETNITNIGGKVGSSVSSKTFCVIAADPNESSGKLQKARALNIPIMTRSAFESQYF